MSRDSDAPPPARPGRCLTVWVLATAAAVVAAVPCLQVLLDPPPGWAGLLAPGHLDDLMTTAGAAAGLVALARLWLIASAAVADALRGRTGRAARRSAVRRAVLLLCGVALSSSVVGPGAHAAVADPSGPAGLAGLPHPDRPSLAATAPAVPAAPEVREVERVSAPAPAPAAGRVHVVRPGDTLWDLAAATLPPDASPTAVDARWRAVHRANRAVVGDDPDLIHPGQELLLPRQTDGDQS